MVQNDMKMSLLQFNELMNNSHFAKTDIAPYIPLRPRLYTPHCIHHKNNYIKQYALHFARHYNYFMLTVRSFIIYS